MLNGILLDARRCNERDGITGALVCRRDAYLQLLEGPAAPVEAAYARIGRDDRHLDVRLLMGRPVADRLFGGWAMLHDPATTWLWSEEAIADGALDRAAPEDVEAAFADIARRAVEGPPA